MFASAPRQRRRHGAVTHWRGRPRRGVVGPPDRRVRVLLGGSAVLSGRSPVPGRSSWCPPGGAARGTPLPSHLNAAAWTAPRRERNPAPPGLRHARHQPPDRGLGRTPGCSGRRRGVRVPAFSSRQDAPKTPKHLCMDGALAVSFFPRWRAVKRPCVCVPLLNCRVVLQGGDDSCSRARHRLNGRTHPQAARGMACCRCLSCVVSATVTVTGTNARRDNALSRHNGDARVVVLLLRVSKKQPALPTSVQVGGRANQPRCGGCDGASP